MADAQISIVAKAIDQASGTLNRVERSANTLEKSMGHLSKGVAIVNSVLQGAGIGIGIGSFYALERAIGSVLRVIPDLVTKGGEWANMVNNISDATGMSAQHASTLAAVQQMLGGSTDSLGRAMMMLARSAVTNQKAFDQLGIKTRDANGNLLDAYDIFQNVRGRISETGASLLSTNAAQKAFGRGAGDLLDLLKLSDSQWAIYADEARKAGLVISDAASQAGEDWARTQNILGAAITGLASQIFQGAAPALIGLVNGITNAIQQNMDSIVQFAVQAVNFVAGLIGGFLGIDFGAATLAQQVNDAGTAADNTAPKLQHLGKAGNDLATGTSNATSAIQKQIDAIDKQIAALNAADQRAQWRKEQHQLVMDIAAARTELESVQGETVDVIGMSHAEQILAHQQHASDVLSAQKKLDDAEKKLKQAKRQHERDDAKAALEMQKAALQQQMQAQQRALTAQKAFMANQAKLQKQWATNQKTDIAKPFETISTKLQEAADSARRSGQEIATAIRTAIFGSDTGVGPNNPFTGQSMITIHQPGLIEKIGGLIDSLSGFANTVGGALSTLNNLLQNTLHTDLLSVATALVGLKIAMSIGSPLLSLLGKIGGATPVPTGGGGGFLGVGAPYIIGGLIGLAVIAAVKDGLDKHPWTGPPPAVPPSGDNPLPTGTPSWWYTGGVLTGSGDTPIPQAVLDAMSSNGQVTYGPPAPKGNPYPSKNAYYGDNAPPGYFMPWFGNGSQSGNNSVGVGIEGTLNGTSMANTVIQAYSPLFERFMGDGSLIGQNAMDQETALGDIGINTSALQTGINATLPDGTSVDIGQWLAGQLGVTNSNFSGIGQVSKWTAGQLAVANSTWGNLFANIGDVSTWSAGNLKVIGEGPDGSVEVATGNGHVLVRPDPNGHSFDVTNANGKTFNVDANTPYGKKLAAALYKSGLLVTANHKLPIQGSVSVHGLVFQSESGDEAFWYNGHGAAAWIYNSYVRLGQIRDKLPSSTGTANPGVAGVAGDPVLNELKLLRHAIAALAKRPIVVQVDRRTIIRALGGAGSQTSSLRPVPGV